MKVILKAPRYYEGQYIDASPDSPVVFDIHDKYAPHKDEHPPFVAYTGQPIEAEVLKPHFAQADLAPPIEVDDSGLKSAPVEIKGKAKRASDREV